MGAYDPANGGTTVTISPRKQGGIYTITMDVPNYFSWRQVDSEGQHPNPWNSELALLQSGWNMMYGVSMANAELRITDYAKKRSKRVALAIGRPSLSADRKKLVFNAQFRSSLSRPLASVSVDDPISLTKTMPQGKTVGSSALLVENTTGTPHDLLSYGIRYAKKTTSAPSNRYAIDATTDLAGLDTGSSNLIQASPNCLKADISKDKVLEYVRARPDVKLLTGGWGAPIDDANKLAIARATMLSCEPEITGGSETPDNVVLVKKVFNLTAWTKLTSQLGNGEMYNGTSNLTDKEKATYSYNNFLRMIGKYPFFCGEQGVYSSMEDACRSEIAAVFGHAAQETGAHDKALAERAVSPVYEWQQAFSKLSEGSCYNTNQCTAYNPAANECPDGYICPSDYYGRGIKQISYFYNYMGFSSQLLGDPQVLLSSPDGVFKNGILGLGSGIWFYMTPQPPKPSMHDVITGGGGYHPTSTAYNISVAEESITEDSYSISGDGNVSSTRGKATRNNPTDKFETTISIINGARECSPEVFEGKVKDSETGATYSKDDVAGMRLLGINRMAYYTELLGYLGSTISYSNNKGCSIDNGAVFGSDVVAGTNKIAYKPLWWVNLNSDYDSKVATSCSIESWEGAPHLNIASERSLGVCLNMLSSNMSPRKGALQGGTDVTIKGNFKDVDVTDIIVGATFEWGSQVAGTGSHASNIRKDNGSVTFTTPPAYASKPGPASMIMTIKKTINGSETTSQIIMKTYDYTGYTVDDPSILKGPFSYE